MRLSGILAAFLVILTLSTGLIGSLLPRRYQVSRSATLKQTPDQIWKALTEFADFPSWRADVKRIERVPAEMGLSGWKEISRFGATTIHVLEADPPRRLIARVDETDLPIANTWIYEISPGASGESTITVTEVGEVYNPFVRLFSTLTRNHGAVDQLLKNLAKKFGETAQPS